jgi:pyruvate dehydrogenase E2 component (dihydrolipoamide acetyltransferase)
VAVRTLIAEIGEPGETVDGPSAAPSAAHHGAERMFVTPRARKRARDLGIELGSLRGSGPHGRIVEADVVAAAGTQAERAPLPIAAESTRQDSEAGVQSLTRIRRITAERMAASAQATARVSLFLDADFSEVVRFRQQLEPEFARLGVPRLPWDAIVARASALALAEHRHMLAQWADGEGLRVVDDVNVGVAVTLEPEGLVVPVLRNADRRSLRELAGDLLDLVAKARAGRLNPAEMQGGGFSITNLGAYRVDGFTPILNPPETAILGVGRIADKPVVVDGSLAVRTMCTLSLSFDHRVVDGAAAAAFLARVAELLERPYALLGI